MVITSMDHTNSSIDPLMAVLFSIPSCPNSSHKTGGPKEQTINKSGNSSRTEQQSEPVSYCLLWGQDVRKASSAHSTRTNAHASLSRDNIADILSSVWMTIQGHWFGSLRSVQFLENYKERNTLPLFHTQDTVGLLSLH
jgi:hypothetical protein